MTNAEWYNRLRGRSLYLLVGQLSQELPAPFTNIHVRNRILDMCHKEHPMSSLQKKRLLARIHDCTRQQVADGLLTSETRRNDHLHTTYYLFTPCSVSTSPAS